MLVSDQPRMKMKPVLLLARAFARQNRWLLLAFGVWPFVLGAFVWSPHGTVSQSDVMEIVRQEFVYGTVVIAFLASSAIYNERRSRRIVAVLSKAVSRGQYLSGLLLGALFFAVAYFAVVDVSLVWITGWSIATPAQSGTLLMRGVVVSFWMASLALLFSTFLYPFVAASLAAITAFAPTLFHARVLFAPATPLVANVNPFSSDVSWLLISVAIAESALFLVLAAYIFERRDVVASVE